jgi:integrase/recombinase XerD
MEISERFKTAGLKPIKIDQAITQDDYLSLDEIRELIAGTPEKTSLIIRALYETACRVSELLSLRFDMVKETKGGIAFSITGKGNKERSVFMSKELFQRIKTAFNGSRYMFVNTKDEPLSRQYVHRLISEGGADVLNIKGLHPHTIRHTFATNNIDRLGLHKVKEYLGHADISTTSHFYIHKKATAEDILQGDI